MPKGAKMLVYENHLVHLKSLLYIKNITIESYNIPKTKVKSYDIPNTNPNLNTPSTPKMVKIINVKPYNIPVTNTLQYPNQTHILFTHQSQSQILLPNM